MRSFEATRFIYNTAAKYNILDEMKDLIGSGCDFLCTELSTDATLSIIKELMNFVVTNFTNSLNALEVKSLLIELILQSVHASVVFFFVL